MKSKLFKTLLIVVVQIMREIIYSQSDSEICKWNIVLSMNSYKVTVTFPKNNLDEIAHSSIKLNTTKTKPKRSQ